ncbi:MAG: DUF4129 domain-containing protein [Bacteroidetes bacterium]|jgi:hypothetical protein|nr:DUF4129 domain-containing protein [Bacteroidota bacterium]
MHKLVQIIIGIFLITLVGNTSVQANELDSSTWVKMSDKYNYSPPQTKKKEEEKPEQKKENKKIPEYSGGGLGTNFINILLYIGIAALIALLIYVLVQADVIKVGSRKVKLNPTYDAENPEELVLSELEKELQDAAQANNYNRCLRYEFLLLLERLQAKGLIRWHKYNTNGEYLNQIIQFNHYKRIRDLTIVYEYYWYGEHVLSLEDYEKIAVLFTQLREEMDHA